MPYARPPPVADGATARDQDEFNGLSALGRELPPTGASDGGPTVAMILLGFAVIVALAIIIGRLLMQPAQQKRKALSLEDVDDSASEDGDAQLGI